MDSSIILKINCILYTQLFYQFCLFKAGQICYAVLCVFSYIAAGHKRTISQTYKEKTQRKLSTYSAESSENKC